MSILNPSSTGPIHQRVWVSAAALLVGLLGLAGDANAVITVVTGFVGTRTLTLSVGTPVPGTIDTVQFNVGGATVGNSLPTAANPIVNGNGTAISAAGGGVAIRVFFQSPAATVPDTLRVNVAAPAALTCIGGNCVGSTIPFSNISWTITTTSALDFQPGTFVNGGTTVMEGPGTLNVAGTVDITNTLLFRYANTTAFPAGTYTGTVIYTATLL